MVAVAVNKAKHLEVVTAALDAFVKPECYRWKGSDHGSDGGKTADWALQHLDRWVETLRPQLAVVMFGTNDIRHETLEQHSRNLRRLVERCLQRGVVVILTTIPPMDGHDPIPARGASK